MMLSADTDLPQPDSPTSATVSPSWMSQDTPSTARTRPPDVRNVVFRFLTWRRVVMARPVYAAAPPSDKPYR